MSAVLAVAIGLLTGILSGFGIGGGSLLLLYLTLFEGAGQYQAGAESTRVVIPIFSALLIILLTPTSWASLTVGTLIERARAVDRKSVV